MLVIGGILGIGGWIVVSYLTGRAIWDVGSWPGQYGAEIGFGVIAYLAGVALFSAGWELGAAGRAIRVAVLLALAGIVIWLVIALVAFALVAILKSDGDGGGSGGGSGGGGASSSGGGMLDGLGRDLGGFVETFVGGGGSSPASDDARPPMACASCGNLVDPNTMRLCPVCSTPVP
jgi:hypothetical protein